MKTNEGVRSRGYKPAGGFVEITDDDGDVVAHPNRASVRFPRRLWRDLQLALRQCVERLDQATDADAQRIVKFAREVLREAEKRESDQQSNRQS